MPMYQEPVTLDAMHNLASHLHTNPVLLTDIKTRFPSYYNEFTHYTQIGSKFCPRVLATMEKIINKMHYLGILRDYETYITTKVEEAYTST